MLISKEKFCYILNRLKNYNDLRSKIDKLFENQIDNKEQDFCNAGGICIGHETVVVDLLEAMFETDLISWWIYEMDYGSTFSIGDIEEQDGATPDLTTVDKLYDYLLKNLSCEVEANGYRKKY